METPRKGYMKMSLGWVCAGAVGWGSSATPWGFGVFNFKKNWGDTPCSMWDLSSLSRDRTHAPCSGSTES